MRLKSDLLAAFLATVDGVLSDFDLRWSDDAALTVVMAANGYPGRPTKGTEIKGLDAAKAIHRTSKFFTPGPAATVSALLPTAAACWMLPAVDTDVAEARDAAYAAIAKINWPGGFYRKDIGWRALQRSET